MSLEPEPIRRVVPSVRVVSHLIATDFRRLRLPFLLFGALVTGKIILYASVVGIFGATDLGWVLRLQEPAALTLRTLLEAVLTFFLVGWMVLADSPVDQHPHWLSRPIAGGQLFFAKLVGSLLVFVVGPLLLNLVWWKLCSFSGTEIVLASLQLIAVQGAVATSAFVLAALTDGFPRFILWSIVGVTIFAVVPFIASPRDAEGVSISRLVVCAGFAFVVGLGLAAHQFITRRHRRSLQATVVAVLSLAVLAAIWRWNLTNAGKPPLHLPGEGLEKIQVETLGGPRYLAKFQSAQWTLRVHEVPASLVVARIVTNGEWLTGNRKLWASRSKMTSPSLATEAIRRMLDGGAPPQEEGRVVVSLPAPPLLVQKVAAEPTSFSAALALDVFQGHVAMRFPLAPNNVSQTQGRFTVSPLLSQRSAGGLRNPSDRVGGKPPPASVVIVTERVWEDGFIRQWLPTRFVATPQNSGLRSSYFVLRNRRTGELVLSDPAKTGPTAFALLNDVRLSCWQVAFAKKPTGDDADPLELVIIQFGLGGTLQRTLTRDHVVFESN